VQFRYGLCDGWLSVTLTVGTASVSHSVGGWHDGLGELFVAVRQMFSRSDEAVAHFQEEPGEFRWRISKLAVNRVRIRVFEFDDWGIGSPDETGKLLFDEACGVVALANAMIAGTAQWMEEVERMEQKSIRRWKIPTAELDQLRAELNRRMIHG
jgi:hypothetical protein